MFAKSDTFYVSPETVKRLTNEIKLINKSPVENITTVPKGDHLLEWYFMIYGLEGKYKGGHYIGLVKHKPTYPADPPAYFMYTPSGRFIPNDRICITNSDYHKESWTPQWNIGTLLTGFLSAWNDETMHGIAHIHDDYPTTVRYAQQSIEYNKLKYPNLYKELCDKIEIDLMTLQTKKEKRKQKKEKAEIKASYIKEETKDEIKEEIKEETKEETKEESKRETKENPEESMVVVPKKVKKKEGKEKLKEKVLQSKNIKVRKAIVYMSDSDSDVKSHSEDEKKDDSKPTNEPVPDKKL